MKICFITFEYPPFLESGAGVYAKQICDEISKLGHKVYVFTLSIQRTFEKAINNGLYVYRFPVINLPVLKFISFQCMLRKNYEKIHKIAGGFDVLHANGVSDFLLTKGLVKMPRVITVHHVIRRIQNEFILKIRSQGMVKAYITGELNPIASYMEEAAISRSSKIIAVSNASKQDLISYYNCEQKKIEVVYNGIDTLQYIFPPEAIERTKRRLKIASEEKLILYAPGRVNDPRKNIQTLLKALSKIASEYPFKCVILGSGGKKHLQKLLVNLGIKDRVVFPGLVNEFMKRLAFSSCDIYVHPSILEGCPISILEAMAAGKPVISTKVGGIPELIKNGRNGILVKAWDFLGLSEALLYLLKNEREARLMGIRNRKNAEKSFSWKTTAQMTIQVYNSLLERE